MFISVIEARRTLKEVHNKHLYVKTYFDILLFRDLTYEMVYYEMQLIYKLKDDFGPIVKEEFLCSLDGARKNNSNTQSRY